MNATDIVIKAFEDEGLVGHIDVDFECIEQFSKKLGQAVSDDKYLYTPELLKLKEHANKGLGFVGSVRVYYVPNKNGGDIVNVAVREVNKTAFSSQNKLSKLRKELGKLTPNTSSFETIETSCCFE